MVNLKLLIKKISSHRHAFHSVRVSGCKDTKKFRGLQIFAPKRHDNSQKVKKMRGLNINKVYAEVYDRYMLGTCSSNIYPISNPDVQRLCGELRYMLTIH